MARSRQQTIAIDDIVFDDALYPRKGLNPLHVNRLLEARDAGTRFPPIIIDQATYRLVDGAHRTEVARRRGEERIPAEFRVYASEADLFAEAVRINAEHGEALTAYDLKNAILRLNNMGYTRERISDVVRMTVDKVEEIQKGFAQDQSGQPIALKGGLRHKRSQILTVQQQATVRRYGGGQAVFYINQLLMLLDNDMWPHESVTAKVQMDKLVATWLQLHPSIEESDAA